MEIFSCSWLWCSHTDGWLYSFFSWYQNIRPYQLWLSGELNTRTRGRNFSVPRYEPVLKIDPYQRNPEKCMDFCHGNWGSILKLDPVGENFPVKFPTEIRVTLQDACRPRVDRRFQAKTQSFMGRGEALRNPRSPVYIFKYLSYT
jgi:hypothetical protein